MIVTKITTYNNITRMVILLRKYEKDRVIHHYTDRLFIMFDKNPYSSIPTYKPY